MLAERREVSLCTASSPRSQDSWAGHGCAATPQVDVSGLTALPPVMRRRLRQVPANAKVCVCVVLLL